MANLHNSYLVLIFTLISLAAYASGCKFCIRHDSEDVRDEHRQCEILATALTLKEKATFYRTMCKDHVKNIRGDYSFFKTRNGDLEDRPSYKELCSDNSSRLLTWVPWATVSHRIAEGIDKKERNFFIGKATNKKKSKTDLCYFSQSALLSNDTKKISCTLMIFEDQFFDVDSDINVLVEALPVFYEIRNVTYEPWTNVTHHYKTLLDKTTLENPGTVEKVIYGSLEYGYMERVKFDTKSIYNGGLEKLPLAFEHKDNVMKILNGTGNTEIKEKAFFGRPLSPKSKQKVDLIGQWSEHHREFRADLYENFGHGYRQYKQPVGLTKISITKISHAEPVYENPNPIVSKKDEKLGRFTQGGLGENITAVESSYKAPSDAWTHPYPDFFPFFVIACVVISLALLLTFGRMLYICMYESNSVETTKC